MEVTNGRLVLAFATPVQLLPVPHIKGPCLKVVVFNLQFVTSPKCQSVLNEIVYYEWPYWQDMSCLTKMTWFFFQLLFVAVSCIFYMPVRLARKFPCCDKDDSIWWRFREKYEHPYSKFINHTVWYLVFLFFIFSTSFEKEFGTTETGLVWLGKSRETVCT